MSESDRVKTTNLETMTEQKLKSRNIIEYDKECPASLNLP